MFSFRSVASFVTFFILCTSVQGLYSKSDDVIQLTDKDFRKTVLKDDGIWLIEFYAPWCGHCKALAPEYKKAAKALKGIVNVAAVDADQYKSIAGQYQVRGFPTIKLFGGDKKNPIDYNGQRDAPSMVKAAMSEAKKVAQARLNGKRSSSSSRKSSSPDTAAGPGEGKNVIQLDDNNFDQLVMNSEDVWLVEFYAPWCGHCKNLAPAWAEAATRLKNDVRMGVVDATVSQSLASRFNIQGFPSIKAFAGGKKSSSSVEDYNGDRSAQAIEQFGRELAERTASPPETLELTSPQVWKEQCAKKGNGICMVAILRHILDDGVEGRNAQIEMLNNVAAKQRRGLFTFVWTEVGKQTDLEKTFDVVGNVPAIVAYSAKKNAFAVHAGAFNQDGISKFATSLSAGTARIAPLSNTPIVHTVDPWDGKMPSKPEEEEFSLEDIMSEEL